jgi:predicted ATPase
MKSAALRVTSRASFGRKRKAAQGISRLNCKQKRDLRLQLGQTQLADADFREAIALAREMSAKARELRAATSLARLLLKQGRSDEARAILAKIYFFFTEGLNTAALHDAKSLLDELET